MAKVPLAEQINAVEGAISMCVDDWAAADIDALKAARETLIWLEEHRDAVVAAHGIITHEAVKAVRDEFPGAKVVGIKALNKVDDPPG